MKILHFLEVYMHTLSETIRARACPQGGGEHGASISSTGQDLLQNQSFRCLKSWNCDQVWYLVWTRVRSLLFPLKDVSQQRLLMTGDRDTLPYFTEKHIAGNSLTLELISSSSLSFCPSLPLLFPCFLYSGY